MSFITNLIGELKNLWTQSDTRLRIVVSTVALLMLAAFTIVALWSSRPRFIPLAANLEPQKAAEVVARLEGEGIRHELNYSGSTVLVPQADWNRAKLAVANIVTPLSSPSSGFEESLFSDPTMNHFRMLGKREESLARTIAQMEAVVTASVHIGHPEPSPFLRDRPPTTASVVLELRPGSVFTREQAASIVALVANSIEGLDADHISVMDTKGRLLSRNGGGSGADVSGQYEHKRNLEADLTAKAETMLMHILGPGRAIVRVTADVDFTESQWVETTFDPDSKVKISEKIRSVSKGAGRPSAGGAAGSGANFGQSNSGAAGSSVVEKEEENETTYDTAKTVDTVKKPTGVIKRLTIAATVNLAPPPAADNATPTAAALTKQQVESIIKQAVGFDQTRNDQIEVVEAELVGAVAATDPALVDLQKWETYSTLLRNASLGIASIVALLLGLLIIRRTRPIVVTQPAADGGDNPFAELTAQARNNPEIVSRIVSAWLGEEGQQQAAEKNPNRGKSAA